MKYELEEYELPFIKATNLLMQEVNGRSGK
jgi:hypothetical protein